MAEVLEHGLSPTKFAAFGTQLSTVSFGDRANLP